MTTTVRLLLLLALSEFVLVPFISAQAVDGEILDRGTGEPVPGVSLSLLDARGDRLDFDLSDADGRFRLSSPIPGVFRIVHERIGFEGDSTAAFGLERDQVLERRLLVATRPIALPLITVVNRDRCTSRTHFDVSTSRLWNEVRKALEVTEWTEGQGRLVYTLRSWERRLEPGTLEVVHEETRRLSGSTQTSPWIPESPEDLVRLGFVRAHGDSAVYNGLDASTVLADIFIDSHCYYPVPAPDERPGWVGLAFAPDGSKEIADVEGVLWVDRESAELRRLDYRFTNLPEPLRFDVAEGRVEFRRMPGGQWIVERWWIRMPIVSTSGRPRRARLLEIEEDGGEVVRVENSGGVGPPADRALDPAARVLWSESVDPRAARGRSLPAAASESRLVARNLVGGGGSPGIYVVALDGRTGATVRGVEVEIPELSLRGRTNREGRVVFEELPPGDHRMSARHADYLPAEATIRAPSSGVRVVQALLMLRTNGRPR